MWIRDIRFALRLLREGWGFSFVVIAILALCIGVNSVVLSVVNAAMLRPLPYSDSDHLVHVVTIFPKKSAPLDIAVDGTTWQLLHSEVPSLETAAYGIGFSGGVNVVVNNTAVFARQGRVSSGFFAVLGVEPLIGREFTNEDDSLGGAVTVVLSYPFWVKHFAADPHILGKSILLLGSPYVVVGVMPRGFEWAGDADLWTPLRPSTTGEGLGTNYGVIGRIRAGASLQEVELQTRRVTDEIRHRRLWVGSNADARLQLVPLQQAVTEDLRPPLRILWIAVTGIFLLGCVNIGGMLIARVSGRSTEFATRLALGATPFRIVVQVLLESIILGLIGGIVGLALAYAGLSALRDLGKNAFPFLQFVDLDGTVMAVTFFLMLFASVASGALPAWQAAHSDQRLNLGGSRTTAGRRRYISLGTMVATQVALAIALLTAATLLLRTFLFLWNLPAGFDPHDVVIGQFSLQDARYDSTRSVTQLFDSVIARLHQTPGIEAAACALALPYEQALNGGFVLPGETESHLTNETYITQEYFATLRIPLLEGRSFTMSDGPYTPPVVIVNQTFASRYLKGRGALGTEIRMGGLRRQIIGVVGNFVGGRPGWGNFGPIGDFPTVFIPASQVDSESLTLIHVWFSPSWIVRGRLSAHEIAQHLTYAVKSIDPLLPPPKLRSFHDLKARALDEQSLLASLVDVLAGLAVLLAVLGIYGLAANLATERTRELAIRIALGATPGRTAWTALAPGLRWVGLGAVGGAALTFSFGKLLGGFLWGIRAGDPLSLLVVASCFLAAAGVSILIPTVRILRIHPADTLRVQ